MTPAPHHSNDEKLERSVHQALRALPARRAPRSLEQRVLAEISRRAALPWWHKSFAYWPIPARAAFIVFLAGITKLVVMGAVWVMAGFDAVQFQAAFTEQFAWMQSGLTVVQAITGFFDVLFRNIPPLWLYGGVAIIATVYALLFGLGAAAYRALQAER